VSFSVLKPLLYVSHLRLLAFSSLSMKTKTLPMKTKVSVHGKDYSEWSSLYQVQSIAAHDGPVWCLAWSQTGMFLASAGQDAVIKVWKVVESKDELPPAWQKGPGGGRRRGATTDSDPDATNAGFFGGGYGGGGGVRRGSSGSSSNKASEEGGGGVGKGGGGGVSADDGSGRGASGSGASGGGVDVEPLLEQEEPGFGPRNSSRKWNCPVVREDFAAGEGGNPGIIYGPNGAFAGLGGGVAGGGGAGSGFGSDWMGPGFHNAVPYR
jgi:hypothetical protein